jgi:hypothetical protein
VRVGGQEGGEVGEGFEVRWRHVRIVSRR